MRAPVVLAGVGEQVRPQAVDGDRGDGRLRVRALLDDAHGVDDQVGLHSLDQRERGLGLAGIEAAEDPLGGYAEIGQRHRDSGTHPTPRSRGPAPGSPRGPASHWRPRPGCGVLMRSPARSARRCRRRSRQGTRPAASTCRRSGRQGRWQAGCARPRPRPAGCCRTRWSPAAR